MTDDTQRQYVRDNRVTHGAYTLMRFGPDSLTEEDKKFYYQLKDLLNDPAGRMWAWKELTVLVLMMTKLIIGHVDSPANIPDNLAKYIRLARELLAKWPEEQEEDPELAQAISVLKAIDVTKRKKKEGDQDAED